MEGYTNDQESRLDGLKGVLKKIVLATSLIGAAVGIGNEVHKHYKSNLTPEEISAQNVKKQDFKEKYNNSQRIYDLLEGDMAPHSGDVHLEDALLITDSFPIGDSGLYKVVIEKGEKHGGHYDSSLTLATEQLKKGDKTKVAEFYYKGHLIQILTKVEAK